jgi:cyclophilin family peptidyl-prolyl cis-trans isomerase
MGALTRARARGLAAALLLAGLACGEADPAGEAAPVVEVPPAAAPRDVAVLDVAGFGEIRIELLADLAPLSAAHFAALAERGYYDGTSFHRVVPGFMIQGGDPNTRDRDPRNDGQGGGEERVPDERPTLSHLRGIVALANRGVPNSASAQFFILVADARHLDGHYAIFGRVVSGMDVADRIVAVERDVYGRYGPPDRPTANVVIRRARVERAPGAGPARVP